MTIGLRPPGLHQIRLRKLGECVCTIDGADGPFVTGSLDPAQIDIGDATVLGTPATLARADHQHAFPGPVAAPPQIAAAGAIGVATTPAHSDHTHAGVASIDGGVGAFVTGTIAPTQIDIGDAQATGTAATAARADHQHAFPAGAAPPAVAAASAAGAATTPARSDHTHAGVTSVNAGAGAVTIVGPEVATAGSVVTIANGNSKNLPGGFVSADITVDANTNFKIPKLTGSVTVPAPPVPTGNIEDRKITFTVISRGTPGDVVTWTTGANGFSWATQLGPLLADFNSCLAAAPNNAIVKVAWAYSTDLAKWMAVGLAGYFT